MRGEDRPPREDDRTTGGDGGGDATDHPMVKLLVGSLSTPGSVWGKADRQKWMALAGSAFDVVYRDEPAITTSGRAGSPEYGTSQPQTEPRD
jgi:hypothetical protein